MKGITKLIVMSLTMVFLVLGPAQAQTFALQTRAGEDRIAGDIA